MIKTAHSPQKVLVTGGGGFLGGAVVARLVRRGDRVRSFARNAYPLLTRLGIEQVRGDLGDSAAVKNACKDMDVVFHVAARPGVWGRYQDYFNTNVLGTQNVIAACMANKVGRLVYTSSPSVVFNGKDMEGVDESVPYPNRFHAYYPETKALAEQQVSAAARQGLMTITLRPHLIWGPGDNHLVPRIIARARQLVRIGKGDNRVDTIFIDNAAEAHLLAADKLADNPRLSGNIYFISQDDPIPLWEMVNHILRAAGLDPVTRSMPAWTARLLGALLEQGYKTLRLTGEPRLTRFVAEELATAHWFDISAAKNDLGYAPRVSTPRGLALLKAWLQKETLKGEIT